MLSMNNTLPDMEQFYNVDNLDNRPLHNSVVNLDNPENNAFVVVGLLAIIGAGFLGLLFKDDLALMSRKAAMWGIVTYMKVRSDYRWSYRTKTPSFLRKIGDRILKVDSFTATVDCPSTLTESLKATKVVLTRKDMNLDVTDKFNDRLKFLYKGIVAVHMEDLVPPRVQEVDEWSLEIMYMGHADPSQKIQASEFAVKYTADASEPIIFPPYSADRKIKRGLGHPKISSAKTVGDEEVGLLAKKYAGLNVNFYKDLTDPHVMKNHIDSEGTRVLISQKGRIDILHVDRK